MAEDAAAADGENKGTVQISLYHYNDDNRIMVYLDKGGGRRGGSAARRRNNRSKGVAGYTSPGAQDVNQEHRVKAKQLATNNKLLRMKLQDKLFLDACFLSGVDPEDLRDQPMENFQTAPNRAQVLTPQEQRLRFEEFQRQRLELLQIVVAEEEKAYVAAAKMDETERMEMQKLQRDFSDTLREEQKQVNRMVKNRQKYERVLEVENRRIHLQREKANKRHDTMKQKLERIERARVNRQLQLKRDAASREARIKKAVKDQEKLAKTVISKHDRNVKRKQERTAHFLKQKHDMQKGSRRQEQLKVQFRNQRKMAAEEREAEKRELLTRRLHAKSEHAEHVMKARAQQRLAKKTERNLRISSRARKAQRLRYAAENRQKKQTEKMERFYRKQAQLDEMKFAIGERRKQLLREEKIRRDKWRAAISLERTITPGPGEYSLPSTLASSGGTFNMSKPKTEMDWVRHRAKELPAPGDYHDDETFSSLNKAGGSWSKYKPKSDVEIAMDRARAQPGPGEYQPKFYPDTTSATFGDAEPLSEIDRVILNASRNPAPGEHQKDNVPKVPKKLNQLQRQFGVSTKALQFAARMKRKLTRRRSAETSRPVDNDEAASRRPLTGH